MKRFTAVSVQEQPRSAFIQFAWKVPLFTAWPFCRWSALTWAARLFIGHRRLYHITMNDVFVWYETRPDLFCDQIIRDGSRHSLPVHSFYRAADCWLQSADSCQRDIRHCCIPQCSCDALSFWQSHQSCTRTNSYDPQMWSAVLMLCCWPHTDSHDSNRSSMWPHHFKAGSGSSYFKHSHMCKARNVLFEYPSQVYFLTQRFNL